MKRLVMSVIAVCLLAMSLSAQTVQDVAVNNEVSAEKKSNETPTTKPEPNLKFSRRVPSRWFELSTTMSALSQSVEQRRNHLSVNQH
jgi:hypothetical protein